MSSFFTAPAPQRKRKRTDAASKPAKKRFREDAAPKRRVRQPEDDADDASDDVSGSDVSDSEVAPEDPSDSEASSEEGETPAERRARLAQRYLDRIREEVDETGFDAEDLDKDIIATRLRDDVDEAKGRQFRLIARTLDFDHADHTFFRADTKTTTAVAVHRQSVYTASKDKTLIKWRLQSPAWAEADDHLHLVNRARKKRPHQEAFVKGVKIVSSAPQQHGHAGPILSLAVSPDGKYVASGGADKKLIIWAADTLLPLKTFTTHRDAVTALDFAPAQSNQSGFGAQLFSASKDRSLKTYSLAGHDSLAYVETLFGHQDHVVGISAMAMDQCVSVGARDRSARLWRVVDETQLKFLGDSARHDEYHTGRLDCVAAMPPQHFVTGSDAGTISLWSMHRKKALCTVQTAHGVDQVPPLDEVTSESDPKVIEELSKHDHRRPKPRAVTALSTLPGTDLVLSGSWDGTIKIWKVSDDKRSLEPLATLGATPSQDTATNGHVTTDTHNNVKGIIRGVINSIAIVERRKEIVNEFGGKKDGPCEGVCVIAGTGKDPRLGRWHMTDSGRDGMILFEVPLKMNTS